MKIEICEQMMQSWLLNCKLCEIAQTNWKISPLHFKTILPKDILYVQKFMNEIVSIDHDELKNLFGKNNAEQFIKQCEIDIIGVKFEDGEVDTVYLADSAFHMRGLGYDNPTRAVAMKIARAAAISQIVFGNKATIKVIFASPFCRPTPLSQISDAVNAILPIVNIYYPNVLVELYFNEEFSEKIYLPLAQNIDEIIDDNDLFMRSLNLAKVSEQHLTANNTKGTKKSSKKHTNKSPTNVTTSNQHPTITLVPSDLDDFKDALLQKKRAEITWVYSDGTQEDKVWNASKFTEASDIYGNLQSRPEWRNRSINGLIEVRVKIN